MAFLPARFLSRGALLCVAIFSQLLAEAQIECPGTAYADPKQRLIANPNIPGAGAVAALVEHLPDDYNSTSKKYPLFVFLHGNGETDGPYDGCRFFQQEYFMVPPVLVERSRFPLSVQDQTGATFKFIAITPHMRWIETATINPLLDYLVKNYRVDPSRIYLTGISSGANMVLQYISNDANAKRVAAVAPVAPCDVLSLNDATVVSNNNLHVYTVKCGIDNCGDPNGANIITNLINSINPSKNLAVAATLPTDGWECHAIPHISWDIAYNIDFKRNINGRNINLFEWMIQFRSAAAGPLPVALEDYSVQLSNGKVYVRWSTSAETHSGHFTIERAGVNQQFAAVGTVPAAGNSGNLTTYEWVDNQPLANISFYRLTQTDIDGEQQFFSVRKILNRVKWDRFAIVSPNPFNEELNVFINVDKIQRVGFTLTDMSGRIIRRMNNTYNEGTAEVKFDTGKLPRGVYFLKVEGEFFSEVQRVVKQ